MNAKILRAFSIERGEENRVFLLLLQSFFIGIFIASYEVIACSLFVNIFEKGDTALAMVCSGVAGIIIVTLYSSLQRKIRFTKLSIINIAFVAALALLLRLSFGFSGVDSSWLIFTIFLMIGPFAVVLILGFWGSAGRLFTLRQGKRLNGLVDSGMIIGMILVSSLMPVLQWIFKDIEDIFFISVASVLVAVVIQIIIAARFNKQLNDTGEKLQKTAGTSNKMKWGQLFKNKFTLNFSIFVTLSMVAAFFIWLSFLDVANENYNREESAVTNFFGVFNAIMLTFTLVIKTTIYSRVMKTYGLKITLLAIAALMIILVTGSVIVGSLSSNFVMFFLMISLTRMFSQSLKLGIENPAQKIFFQPLDRSYRYDVQAKIEGIVNEAAGILAGLLLMAIFKYLSVINAMQILIGILVLWLIAGIRLYREYQSTLKSSLNNLQSSGGMLDFSDDAVSQTIESNMQNSVPEKVIYTLDISKSIQPLLYMDSIKKLLNDDSDKIKSHVLKQIAKSNLFSLKEELQNFIKNQSNPSLKEQAEEVLNGLNIEQNEKLKFQDLYKLSRSRDANEKEYVVKLIGLLKDESTYDLIADLTRDINPNVRFAIIQTIFELRIERLYGFIIDQLDSTKYRAAATSALISIGPDILDLLDQSFYKSGYSTPALKRIVKIMGIIGGAKAIDYLITKITYPDRRIVNQSLLSLRSCGYTADETNRNRLHQIIETYIANIAWHYATEQELNPDRVLPELQDSIQQEIADSFEILYLLLSLAYDAQSISNIKENIESGTSESISYAIELLDLVIIEDLKPKLFPLLEDNNMGDKLTQLRVHFPRENFNSMEVLLEILNRDYNLCNRWTKVCAMMSILRMKKPKVTQDIAANIFNPDRLLREAAATVIHALDPKEYSSITDRIPQHIKSDLDKLFQKEGESRKPQMFEEVMYLSKVAPFDTLSGTLLCDIVDHLKVIQLEANEVVFQKNISALGPLMIVKEGLLSLKTADAEILKFGSEEVVGDMFMFDSDLSDTRIVTEMKSTVYYLQEDDLYMLMYENNNLTDVLISLVDKRLQVI